ncbi:MAG: methyltransferase domain-containing protein [Actinomycetota bacterium]
MDSWTERRWLYELLACPSCGTAMEPRSGDLSCAAGHDFPVLGGIPRFTPVSTYADSFGFEWTSFPRLQLDTEESQESEETFRIKTGLGPEDIRGKTVLDAGCGMGRFTHVVAGWGADRVVGVDISRAVDAAAGNLGPFQSAALVQADLRSLPFAPGSFDLVFSIGVLHHTPDTFQSLARIAALVRPGGTLAVWVYSRNLRWRFLGGDLIRPLTSRMRPESLFKLLRWVVPRTRKIKQTIPASTAVLDFILPTSNHQDLEWQILDTFDWYSPRYQSKHTYDEVEEWFRRIGFVDVMRLGFPVAVRGSRPA